MYKESEYLTHLFLLVLLEMGADRGRMQVYRPEQKKLNIMVGDFIKKINNSLSLLLQLLRNQALSLPPQRELLLLDEDQVEKRQRKTRRKIVDVVHRQKDSMIVMMEMIWMCWISS